MHEREAGAEDRLAVIVAGELGHVAGGSISSMLSNSREKAKARRASAPAIGSLSVRCLNAH